MDNDSGHPRMTRRTALQLLSRSCAAVALPTLAQVNSGESPRRTGMGLVIYDCNFRRKWMRRKKPDFDLFEPLTFLKHCQSLGAGGMQAKLGVMKPQQIRQLRDLIDRHHLFVDAIVRPPIDKDDVKRFEAEIKTAGDVKVQAARATIIPGRRYERFKSLAEFRNFEKRGRQMLELAVPVLKKHGVPLAVENHKDQRIDERIALFKHLSCELIGACVDTGNSFALLDDPYGAIEALAPYAFTVHLKDQALKEYEDGFLLGDIPLGQGSFDLKRMVRILQKAKPRVRFALELITRDPLRVPCLTKGYWTTMPMVPASELARTIRFVRAHPAKHLQQVSTLSLAKQVQLEDNNVLASLAYARTALGL